MSEQIKVLLVDDNAMLREWVDVLLSGEDDITIVGEAADGEVAIAQVETLKPDIVLMDMSMLKLNVTEVTRQIVARFPHSKVIALSINSVRHVIDDLLRAGAAGYLLKESAPEELLQGIRTVMHGDIYLSRATTSKVISAYVENLSRARPEDSLTVDTDILQTRLHPPVMTPDLLARPRLFESLDKGRVRPLILVSAGAGYGKSVLISSWLTTIDWSSAWLSLDQSDSDLRQFLRYFVAALRASFPGACEQIFSLTKVDQLPPLHILTTILCNELEALDQPFIIVLDDYHLIDARSPVHELVQKILALPPIPLHLVIITRRDPPLPLVVLRAQDQVADIRMQNLQFTEAEARKLLEKTTIISINDHVLRRLQQEMEGWPVGLRLASLALNQVDDMDSFLKDLHGGIRQMQEYLLYEVLARQSPKQREWLLKTAILDRYSRPLIEAVCAVESTADVGGLNGEEFINSLLENNLFTIPLDNRGEWFRYHHLFQHLLQRELGRLFSAEQIAGLHARASEWFESEGLIDESLHHARALAQGQGNNELVVQIVERNARPMRNEGKWYIVSKWMSQLPDEAVQQHPELLLSLAWEHYYRLNHAAIPALLDQVDTLMGGGAENHELSGEVAVFRGFFSFFSGQGAQSLNYIEHALKRVPLTESEFRAQAEILFAIAGNHEGQQQRVITALNAWLDEQPLHPLREVSLLWGQFYVHYVSGDLEGAKKHCQQGLAVARQHDMKNFTAWFLYFEALIYLQRGELDAAIELLEQAITFKYYHYTRAAVDALVALTLAYQMRAQSQQADATLRTLSEFVRYLGPSFTGLAEACATRLAIMQGQSDVSWLRTGPPPAAEMMVCWFELPHITRCRALIAGATAADLGEAEQCLLELTEKDEALHNPLQMIGILALLAVACEKQGKTTQANAHLQQALALGQPSRIVFPFLELGQPMADLLQRLPKHTNADFATQILSASGDKVLKKVAISQSEVNTKGIAWNGEHLTNREIDILELLAQRLQNKEIAARLFVSPETVKSHLKHLYDKLSVNNRRDASAQAGQIISSLRDESSGSKLTEVE